MSSAAWLQRLLVLLHALLLTTDGEPLLGFDDAGVSTVEGAQSSKSEAGIAFENYSFTYIDSAEPVLRNISLTIHPGELVIIAGSSGCGKSTLLRSINGLIPHMYHGALSGSVRIDGANVAETSIVELAKKVGFVFQNPENQIFMFTVERDIAFGLENLGVPRNEIKDRVTWALQLLGIEHLAARAPHELSDGQKQRVALAGVLAMKPSILILDEPTSLLDPSTALELIEIVKMLNRDLGVTILIVEHRLDLLAQIASRIVCMDQGRVIFDGPPRSILATRDLTLIGIGVPTSTRLYNLLKDGVDLGEPPLTTEELAAQLGEELRKKSD
ncbi:MAG: ATP-binding cassette domain-containing protein [Thaumarchaeota archaeon]|nr:ATP-binding cassette domain-containing protein [Nitrososphaerota archaeon]